ncbi:MULTISPECIES: DUF4179 domain-containing protein [unclassified Paenibacillus]|uniref:DUF4179 domain-containing protein n=1 Tax=unclassified Paenibacillus TaxID=185978 RepID=UPI0030F5AD7F
MKSVEDALKLRLNNDHGMEYPDFASMWERMEQAGHTGDSDSKRARGRSVQRQGRNLRKSVVALSLAALLAAAPVYAAIQVDWNGLLHGKSGIQAALSEHLGQELEQSVTRDGVTLTLHTAVVDENRTVILYSLNPGEHNRAEFMKFKGISLRDEQGNLSEGILRDMVWDAGSGRYTGYVESNWTPEGDTAKVEFIARDLQSFTRQEQELEVDNTTGETQSFNIAQDDLQALHVQMFPREDNRLLVYSEITFEQEEAAAWAKPQVVAYRDGAVVKELTGSLQVRRGDNGEYISQQFYRHSDVSDESTAYRLQYMKEEERLDGKWSFDLNLSKKQMNTGTAKYALNKPLETGSDDITLEQMVVTPTQIRISYRTREAYAHLPYEKLTLEVQGMSLQGELWSTAERDPNKGAIRFERPSGLVMNGKTPVTLTGKYKITNHKGERTPIRLTAISGKRQSVTSQVGGYPVVWIYYTLDGDLYVETGSQTPGFGGIVSFETTRNNSYFAGETLIANYSGDDDNTAIKRYEGVEQTKASMYVSRYITVEPDQMIQVQLLP